MTSDDNVIRVGDLVAVVAGSPCCGSSRKIGSVFTVANIAPGALGRCQSCGAGLLTTLYVSGSGMGHTLTELQKIQPPKQKADSEKKELVAT